jgi:hypothetical protein
MSTINNALVSYEQVIGAPYRAPVTPKNSIVDRYSRLEQYTDNKKADESTSEETPTTEKFRWYYDGGSKPKTTTAMSSTPLATKGNLAKNAEYAYNYLKNYKIPTTSAASKYGSTIPTAAIAGIVGNLYHEDLGNPLRTVNDSHGTTAYGIAGFNSKGDLPNLMKWAKDNGISGQPNFDQQLDYLAHVISSGRDAKLTEALMSKGVTPESASYAWGRYFERFAGKNGRGYLDINDPEHQKRGGTSRQLFAKYG